MNNNSLSNVVFDIEANGLKPDTVWCLVAKEVDGTIHRFGPNEIDKGITLLVNSNTLIGHNILGYDIPVLEKLYNVKFNNKIIDTLVLSRLFNPVQENGHSLKTWGYRLGMPKMEQPEFESFTPEMLDYCSRDVQLNEAVYKALLKSGRGFSTESIELEHEVAKILKTQEEHGFLFDEQSATMLVATLKEKMFTAEKEVHKVFKPRLLRDKLVVPKLKKDGTLSRVGLTPQEFDDCMDRPFYRKKLQAFNLGSRKQIGEYLVDFGWKPKKFTPTGQPIVDENILSKIDDIPQAKLIADYLLYQKRIAQVDSWLEAIEEDGRVHGLVIPNGTITGRMTHRKPNMAQVPNMGSLYGKECRSCWIVPEGFNLLGVDASGLELRMLAHYMKDEDYKNEILHGDIHTANQNMAGLETRDQAKTFIYAFVYGAGDAKIGQIVGGNKASGKALKDRFLSNLPALKSLRERVNKAASRGFLKGIDGRKIYVRSEHAALNTLLQGGGAIVMKKGLTLLQEKFNLLNVDAKFVGNIHDEWQIEVKSCQASKAGHLAVSAIQEAGKHFDMFCPLDGEYKIGENWSETH